MRTTTFLLGLSALFATLVDSQVPGCTKYLLNSQACIEACKSPLQTEKDKCLPCEDPKISRDPNTHACPTPCTRSGKEDQVCMQFCRGYLDIGEVTCIGVRCPDPNECRGGYAVCSKEYCNKTNPAPTDPAPAPAPALDATTTRPKPSRGTCTVPSVLKVLVGGVLVLFSTTFFAVRLE